MAREDLQNQTEHTLELTDQEAEILGSVLDFGDPPGWVREEGLVEEFKELKAKVLLLNNDR